MRKENHLVTWVTAALLCAIGIVIPMVCPKIVIGPASFTLASHVPIFLAMFISPPVAVAVALGTALGFFFAGLNIVIVLRALSHVVFAAIGAFWLKRQPQLLSSVQRVVGFGLIMAVIHASCEVLVVSYFYFGNQLAQANYANGFLTSVLMLVGLGGIVHSMIDYSISVAVWKPLGHTIRFPASVKNVLTDSGKIRKEA
jgi:niacin transporter